MSIGTTLFPPSNREAALVAFLRTFWQVVRGAGVLAGGGIITVSATQLMHINLTLLAYTVGAVLLAGILSGALAAGDILSHGLPTSYTNAALASIPAAIVTPIPAPTDPAQPAAGTPPAHPSFDAVLAGLGGSAPLPAPTLDPATVAAAVAPEVPAAPVPPVV
jgi:hypothetical protein